MNRFWQSIISPIFESIEAKHIVEIGCDSGKNTKNILQYCVDYQGKLSAIDPFPNFDVQEWEQTYGNIFNFYKELSLSALPILTDYDIVLIDGDHNWYTVYNELKIIEKFASNGKFPVILLHDIGWPYGKRDLYYNPNNIPEIFRQPYKQLGMIPGQSELSEDSRFNMSLNNAIYENNLRNGILTAIEDFLSETQFELEFIKVNVFNGLGIIYSKNHKVQNEIDEIISQSDIFSLAEEDRIANYIQIKNLNYEINLLENKYKEKIEKINNEKSKLIEKFKEVNQKVLELENELVDNKKIIDELTLVNKQKGIELKKLDDKNNKLELTIKEKDEVRQEILSLKNNILNEIYSYKISIGNNQDLLNEKLNLYTQINELQQEIEVKNFKEQKLTREHIELTKQLAKKSAQVRRAEIEASTHLNSIKYRIGDAFVSAARPSKHTLLLPIKLVKLFFEGLSQNRKRPDISVPVIKNADLEKKKDISTINKNNNKEKKTETKFDIKLTEPNEAYENMIINVSHGQLKEYTRLIPYLNWSVLNKEIKEPFDNNKKNIISAMEDFRNKLNQLYIRRSQDKLVSIIMPTLNRANVIKNAINSVIGQKYKNWELIIIDDGGKDNTKEVVDSYNDKRIKYIRSEKRKGVSAARNIGLKNSIGELIAYLDSDNDWYDDYLLLMVNTLKDNTQFKSIYCGQELYECSLNENIELKSIRFGLFHKSLLENRNYIDMNIFMHDRGLYDKLGGFDENMPRLVDWDLILRYTNCKLPYALPCLLSRYYFGKVENQITQSKGFTKNLDYLYMKLAKNKLDLKYIAKFKSNTNPYGFYSSQVTFGEKNILSKKVSIIIPNYEALDCLKLCVEAIKKYTSNNMYELIIVDNNSDVATKVYLKSLQVKNDAKVILNEHNMGFTYAVNQGIDLADKEADIILMNNDAIVTEGWLEALYMPIKDLNNVGIVAPRQVLPPFTKTNTVHVPFCRESFEVDVNISEHHDNIINPLILPEKGYMHLSFVAFFCVLITRECISKVGKLDHENGRHYKSDRLYCNEIIKHDFKLIYTPHSKVYHFLQQSTADLKKKSPNLYKTIFVKNNWEDLKQTNNN